jgi:hypothetical protein
VLKLLVHSINFIITASQHWQDSNWRLALRLMAERKRDRNLQELPSKVYRFLRVSTPLLMAA